MKCFHPGFSRADKHRSDLFKHLYKYLKESLSWFSYNSNTFIMLDILLASCHKSILNIK